MEQKVDLTQGNILKGFVIFTIPLFGGSLFQLLYGTVDMLFVGNFLGKNNAAAVGASSILVTCLVGLLTGISVGAGAILAQIWGARNMDEADVCIENSLLLGGTGGILLTIIGIVFAELALQLLHTPKSIMVNALIYIRIYLLSIIGMVFYNMAAGLLRAMGDSRTPFVVLATGGVLNVIMDALFIVILKWGVAGAALATVISQYFTAVVLVAYLIYKNQLWKKKWKINSSMFKRIMNVGVPVGVQSMVLTLSNLFVQYYINELGENAVAAFTVYFKVENMIYLPIMAFGQAMLTFTGQNIGAKNIRRIQKGAIVCNIFSATVIGCISAVVLNFSEQILGWFCNDQAVITEGMKIVWISFPFYFIYAILEVTGGIVRGYKKTMQSMAIVILNLCIIRVLLLDIFTSRYHTIRAIAMVYPITWILAAMSFIIYYCSIQYKNRKYIQKII